MTCLLCQVRRLEEQLCDVFVVCQVRRLEEQLGDVCCVTGAQIGGTAR